MELFIPAEGRYWSGKQGLLVRLRNGDFLSLERTDTVLFITVITRLVPLGFIICVCSLTCNIFQNP